MSENKNIPSVIQLNNYVKPVLQEVKSKEWILNGENNEYFDYVKERYIGSPTNSAIINTYKALSFGKGLSAKNANRKPLDWVKLLSILPKNDLKKVVDEYLLQGNAAFQVIKNKGGNEPAKLKHLPIKTLAPQKANEEGEVEGYWYCTSWADYRKEAHKPIYFSKWTPDTSEDISILYINDCETDTNYYSLPNYQSGLQYAQMEEEISNYYINHIKNGFSFGYVVNMNNGIPETPEMRLEIERKIKSQLTGSSNAGKMVVSFNNGKDAEITIVPLVESASHKQWETINKESEEKLMRAHRVVSPMLFGIKNNSGLGNNADELDTALKLTMDMVINPIQYFILDKLEPVLESAGIVLDLYFKPINEEEQQAEQEQEQPQQLSDENPSRLLIDLGEDAPDANEWELISSEAINGVPLEDSKLQLAALPSTPKNKSEQDNALFKIRYIYAGRKKGDAKSPMRQFCQDMIRAGKVYRKEDIDAASSKVIQKGMGPGGSNTYDIFLYKGGVNCNHFFQRQIYLRKNNKKISVNQAQKMILELDPSDRADVRLPKNDPKVAQAASAANNFWKL